jgi:hypothetical protein
MDLRMANDSESRLVTIIVNWERPLDTIACIQSLPRPDINRHRILVVDNGSQDDSVAKISVACPDVELLALPRNIGFSGGYNTGIRTALQADVTHILLLNNDTVAESAAVERLLAAPWDIAVPKILFHNEPNYVWAAGARWRRWPPSVVMNGFGKPVSKVLTGAGPLEYATGCALLICRRVLESVTGFDEDYMNYLEDYDFTYRARKAGFTIGYVPESLIFHKVSSTMGEGSSQKWWYLGRNTVLFYRKHDRFPAWMLWLFVVWVSLRELLRGNRALLPHFWRGVKAGRSFMRNRAAG